MAITWMSTVSVLLLIAAVVGIREIAFASLQNLLLVFASVLLVLIINSIDLLLIQQTGQFFFSNPSDCTAIIDVHGRTWAVEKTGSHFALPFLEKVEAFIQTLPREWEIILDNLPLTDGAVVSAHLKTRYRIVDARRVWNAISPIVPRIELLGEERAALRRTYNWELRPDPGSGGESVTCALFPSSVGT